MSDQYAGRGWRRHELYELLSGGGRQAIGWGQTRSGASAEERAQSTYAPRFATDVTVTPPPRPAY